MNNTYQTTERVTVSERVDKGQALDVALALCAVGVPASTQPSDYGWWAVTVDASHEAAARSALAR